MAKTHFRLIALLTLIAALWTGCDSGSERSMLVEPVTIHQRVFEVPTSVVDPLFTADRRHSPQGSSYQIVKATAAESIELFNNRQADTDLLVDRKRSIHLWPHEADTWAYSRATNQILGGGSGSGFFGIKMDDNQHLIRIDHDISHTINTTQSDTVKLFYEGGLTEHQPLIALNPFERKDGTKLTHVIIFELQKQ